MEGLAVSTQLDVMGILTPFAFSLLKLPAHLDAGLWLQVREGFHEAKLGIRATHPVSAAECRGVPESVCVMWMQKLSVC